MIWRALLLALAPALPAAACLAGGVDAHPLPLAAPIPATEWQPRAGDIVLTAADDLIGSNIREASGGAAIYSHVGVVVAREGRAAVVEATPFGSGTVTYADLDAFTRDAAVTDLLVLRPAVPFDAARLNQAAERLTAARTAFDYELDMSDQSAIYCAELAFTLLRDAGVDLASLRWDDVYVPFTGQRRLVTPDAFAHTAKLTPVYRRRQTG